MAIFQEPTIFNFAEASISTQQKLRLRFFAYECVDSSLTTFDEKGAVKIINYTQESETGL